MLGAGVDLPTLCEPSTQPCPPLPRPLAPPAGDPEAPTNLAIVDSAIAVASDGIALQWDAPRYDVVAKYTWQLTYYPGNGASVAIEGQVLRDNVDTTAGATWSHTIPVVELNCGTTQIPITCGDGKYVLASVAGVGAAKRGPAWTLRPGQVRLPCPHAPHLHPSSIASGTS